LVEFFFSGGVKKNVFSFDLEIPPQKRKNRNFKEQKLFLPVTSENRLISSST